MISTKEKFIQTLIISDEGMEMMLQRVRRLNPNSQESELIKLLREELKIIKKKNLPRHLKAEYEF